MDQLRQWRGRWDDIPQPRKIRILQMVVFACYSLALLFLVIYVFGGTTRRVSNPASVVVFTECMPGSIAALRYLIMRADVSVSMIILTVNTWNVNLNAAYENVLGLLIAMRKEGLLRYDIPIYYGNSVAQVNSRFIDEITFSSGGQMASSVTSCTYRRVLNPDLLLETDSLFGASEILYAADIPEITVSTVSGGGNGFEQYEFFDAPLSQYLSRYAATFLVLGPSTDAAWFLQQHPERRGSISNVIVAGGAVLGSGNTGLVYPPNQQSEMHMFFDPHAANYLMSGDHGLSVVLLPLDASPSWPKSLYETYITSRVSSVSVPLSARVVAYALNEYNKKFHTESVLPIQVLAASYFADMYTRNGVTIAEVPLLVANGVSLAKDGMLGEASGASHQKNMRRVKVILRVEELSFWMRFDALDRIPT